MEHIMEAGAGWKLETNGHVVDELETNGRAPIEAGLQLARAGLRQGRGSMLSQAEERPVAHQIRDVAVLLVVVQLLDRLGLLEPVADVGEELSPFLHAFGDCSNTRVPRLVGPNRRQVPAIDDPEQGVPKRGLVRCVEDELRP